MLGEIIFAKAAHEKILGTINEFRDWLIEKNIYLDVNPSTTTAQAQKILTEFQQ